MRDRRDRDPADDWLGGILRKEGQDDDIIVHYVNIDGELRPIYRSERQVDLNDDPADPQNDGFPQVKHEVFHYLDDHGNPISSSRQVSLCYHGCLVGITDVFRCRLCRCRCCTQHAFFVAKKRAFCRRPRCYVIGRIVQFTLWCIRTTVLGAKLITGIETQRPSIYGQQDPEDKIFGINHPTAQQPVDLTDEEKNRRL